MSSLSKGLNNRLKAEPRQFCKIEKIFVYASGFQLRNKVLAQVEQGRTLKLGKDFDPDLDDRFTYALRTLERQGYVLDYTRSRSIWLKSPRLYRNDLYTTFYWKDSGNPYSFEAYFSVPTGLAWPLISLGYGLLKPGQHKIFDSKASMRPGYEE